MNRENRQWRQMGLGHWAQAVIFDLDGVVRVNARESPNHGGVEVYPETVAMIRRLKAGPVKTAVVTSRKDCEQVLAAAKIADLFDAMVDGSVSAVRGLQGKPAPDIFVKAAEDLNVSPARAMLIADANSGIEAGQRGGFGFVIAIDRSGRGRDLNLPGADRVVGDPSEIAFDAIPRLRRTTDLPAAQHAIGEVTRWCEGRTTVLFLDFDGTLTPIVDRPEQADLSGRMRHILQRLSERIPVAIVSGRGLADVRRRVGLDRLYYAGSHGFEIDGPGPTPMRLDKGRDALPALDKAEKLLNRCLADIDGAQVERKKFTITVHYRRAGVDQAGRIEDRVDAALLQFPALRKSYGKKVFELQPDLDWDKGRAVRWLLEQPALTGENVWPVYIGDDVTDEDAFRVLQGHGAGIVVHGGEHRRTCAGYALADPGEVMAFLQALAAGIDATGQEE